MRLGLIGYGNIARTLCPMLAERPLDHVAVLARPAQSAEVAVEVAATGAGRASAAVTDARAMIAAAPDLVVECAGHEAVRSLVPGILRAGIDVVLVSIGALSDAALHAELVDAAEAGAARLILPAGAVGGIDLLAALAPAGGLRVRYRGTKPPGAWTGTPAERAVDLSALTGAQVFYQGTAREAARDYPRNANVAATLALAGAGFEATEVALVADPAAPGNVHEYEVESPLARYSMRIENTPSPNAKTSLSTVYSVLREVRNHQGPVAI